MENSEQPLKDLYLFDLDDTLVELDKDILQINHLDEHLNLVKSITYRHYLDNGLPSIPEDHFWDFRDFYESTKFAMTISPIEPVIKLLNYAVLGQNDVRILTARSHFSDREVLKTAISSIGIDPNIEIHCAGFISEPTNALKKQRFLEEILKPWHASVVIYDDQLDNLRAMRKVCNNMNIEPDCWWVVHDKIHGTVLTRVI